jgi:hypothetical protein
MTTVDQRTRFQGDAVALDPTTFLTEYVPAAVDANGPLAGLGAGRLGLPPLTLDVEGEALTFAVGDDGRMDVRRGSADELVVALDRAAFSDLVQDLATTFGLQLPGRVEVHRGAVDAYLGWEPVLRALLDGRPVHEPGSIDFRNRNGDPMPPHRSFRLDDDPAEIGHFLTQAGFLHLEGVFTEEEMAAVSTELDGAIAAAEPDDGASWWARTKAGEHYPARILGFNQKSPTLQELLRSERFRTIASFTDDEWVQRNPDVGDSAEGLLKKVGVIEGISDVSWHKDCSIGGHSRGCSGLTVGISVTGAGPENGELGAVAGSNRANVVPLGVEGLELPKVPLPTRTGDLTVHCSCTLHMSRPPVSAERRVVYTGFGLAPRPGDHRPELTPEEIRAQRASLNDHVRTGQLQTSGATRLGNFDL